MPSNMFDLGRVILTSSADGLEVSATCAAVFQVPQYISTLNHADILQAFKSGNIFTTRGVGCSLDIRVLLDGKSFDTAAHAILLDKLGRQLLDSKIWPRLSLVPGLEDLPVSDLSRPDLSISLRHGQSQRTTKRAGSRWPLEKTDLIPPEDVCRAELDGIQVELNFQPINQPERVRKQTGKSPRSKSPDLNDDQARIKEEYHVVELEKTVERLPCSVAANFNQNGPTLVRVGATTAEEASGSRITPSSNVVPTASLKIPQQANEQSRSYSKDITHTLKPWLESHTECTYPTAVEKQQLMNLTGLRQLNHWFNYNRKNLHARLLLNDGDEMLFSRAPNDGPCDDEDIDLLFQSVDDSSLVSETSQTSSTINSVSRSSTPRTTDTEESDEQGPELSIQAAEKLLDGVLQVVIGGYYRKIYLPRGVKLEKPAPETCLSQLVPNMFNPGYREIMVQNFRFLPGIVRFTAKPLPAHLQPPSLKQKLAILEAMPISPLSDPNTIENRGMDITERISRVLTTRIFSMMQRSLYDPINTRKVWKKEKDDIVKRENENTRIPDDQDPDLLDEESSDSETNEWDDLLSKFISDGGFDDILGDGENEDDDLLDETEHERLETERTTEEMLFGDGGCTDEEEGDDYLLSGDESDGGDMLL